MSTQPATYLCDRKKAQTQEICRKEEFMDYT